MEKEEWKMVLPLRERLQELPQIYSALVKLRLSALVIATTAAGFGLTESWGNWPLLGWTTAGVALCSFSANAFNQWLEMPFDSQMNRTRLRPLPSHRLSPFHAFHFALVAGLVGIGMLAVKVGGLAALLAGGNILLYAAAYTPLKRLSLLNTWVGALVGAIPPMIGHVAGSGGLLAEGCILGAILYCWQFPHFNALSWYLRGDYARAGYCMAAVLNPTLTLNSALSHAIALVPLSGLAVLLGLTGPYFLLSCTLLNAPMIWMAMRFRSHPNRSTARPLFLYSLLHLPLLLLLMIWHRRRRRQQSEIEGKEAEKTKSPTTICPPLMANSESLEIAS